MSGHNFLQNYSWDQFLKMRDQIIDIDGTRYQYLRKNLVDKMFPILGDEDKILLLYSLTIIINFIYLKFDLTDEQLFWNQLTQNNLLDLRAILLITLPYINTANGDHKNQLKHLSDLYLTRDAEGNFIYTNSQYNRCIRHYSDGKTLVFFRPLLKEYYLQHMELLLMSIETISNKLFINWVDVVPMPMNRYTETQLYQNSLEKFSTIPSQLPIINNYIDPNPGLSYQDFYNVISNHLFNEIKNEKWLIYDLVIGGKPISYISYLEEYFDLTPFWDHLLWSQLRPYKINKFTNEWNRFFNSGEINHQKILNHFYFFFSKYHQNATELIEQGKLILTRNLTDEDEEDEENTRITPQTTRDARIGLQSVPIEEIYLFFYNQLSSFKRSWYYYITKIKKQDILTQGTNPSIDVTIYLTPKNIYNYCKSLVHYQAPEYTRMPRFWTSLNPTLLQIVMVRIFDAKNPKINDWSKPNWFSLNKYIKRIYPTIPEESYLETNYLIHQMVRSKLIDVVFQSLIYHGILSHFEPNPNITNSSIMMSKLGINVESSKEYQYKRQQIKESFFVGQKKEEFENDSYYFVTGNSYGQLPPLYFKDYPGHQKKYFDFLTSNQIWTFTYAMNWVSQINFYHHYLNQRVIYITGDTGVGKSTQVPKLLMYGQMMVDYQLQGKIICTQPRISPTVLNAETISREMGVPIRAYDSAYNQNIFTSNFYVQYQYKTDKHVLNTDSFLRIVTDGTLYTEMESLPFLTGSTNITATDLNGNVASWMKSFSSKNKYDILIVDEAHEHNTNMDMILTLARDAAYVNNSLKLVIVSATMEDDEPIYRRYYRQINDNRKYPPNSYLENQELDRANLDRRIHISQPGGSTRSRIKDIDLPKSITSTINADNFVEYGIRETINIISSTTEKDLLLFLSGQKDIHRAVKEINQNTASNVIALGYYSAMSEEDKSLIDGIDKNLAGYTRYKEDVFLEPNEVTRHVPPGTYTRAVIIATNVAEASITLPSLGYVVDTGFAKTVVYDPLENVNKILTLPISKSSSIQRRGRVGRVAAGEVYYLYDRAKIYRNKTTYKIADSNVKNTIVPLLKSNPADSPIIDYQNDINSINVLQNISDVQKNGQYSPSTLIYQLLKNPTPYLDIIKNKYLYIPKPNEIDQYYLYYGKTDRSDYTTIDLETKFLEYCRNNHDDYHYQKSIHFLSRCYTGYDDFILEDQSLSFYLIHPDENVIVRNPFIGDMVGLKYSPAVSNAYYYYLLKNNGINIKMSQVKNHYHPDINYQEFFLLKYLLTINDAILQLLVLDVPVIPADKILHYPKIINPLEQQFIYFYFITVPGINNKTTTIRTTLMDNVKNIGKIVSATVLEDINDLLWYTYAIPHDVETDVLALIIMIKTVPTIKDWIGPVSSAKDIVRFFETHRTKWGDICFLYQLWTKIKSFFQKNNLFQLTKINIQLESQFRLYKNHFWDGTKLPFDQFIIFNKLYQSGKLNTEDEFYDYLGYVNIDQSLAQHNYAECLNIIAKQNYLNPEKLIIFTETFLKTLFEINKYQWIQNERQNKQQKQTGEIIEETIFDWARRRLSFPGITNGPHYVPNDWDRIYESYVRVFSINLIKNEIYYYLRINKAFHMLPAYWSERLQIEKTFLSEQFPYLIYHNTEFSDEFSSSYLTPVKIEWVMELNPIYYFYLLYSKNNPIYFMNPDPDINQAISIIDSMKKQFPFQSLISYLDQLDNPSLSKIIHQRIDSIFK